MEAGSGRTCRACALKSADQYRLDDEIFFLFGRVTKKKRRIPAPQFPASKALTFSFKYLETDSAKFPMLKCDQSFWTHFAETIKRYCSFTVDDFRDQNNNEKRHTIYWPETTEPEGFTCLDQDTLRLEEAWQIPVCPGEHAPPRGGWRAYGFLLENVFYIVWLDTKHQLWLDSRYLEESVGVSS